MYYVSPSFHSYFFFIRIKQIIYLFSVFFQARSTATIFANERDVFPLLPATSICCAAVLWLSIARSARNSLISSTPFLICLARNCKRTATAAVAALVQKRKNCWTDTEEKILVEPFGENEDKLRYKAFSSPEWLLIARQLHPRSKEQNVDSDRTPQQCKNKLENLTNFV